MGNNLENRLSINHAASNRPKSQVAGHRNVNANSAQANSRTKIAMQTARKNVQKAKRILANKRRTNQLVRALNLTHDLFILLS